MLFKRLLWKSLDCDVAIVIDIVIFHNFARLPFHGFTHNFMPMLVYLMETPHHGWVHTQFFENMLDHECI